MKPRLPITRARVFAEGLDHPECVALHPDGRIYAGGEAGQIYEISPDGKQVREIASTGGFILGVAVRPDGKELIACDLKKRVLWRLELASRRLSLFADKVEGEPMVLPNHLAFAQDGRLFVSDSGGVGKPTGRILCFDQAGNGALWSRGPFHFANGIALGHGETALYVVCSLLPGVKKVPIRPDGTAGRPTVFVRLPKTVPDGVLADRQGRILIACYAPNRIYRVSAQGVASVLIDDWFSHTLSNPTNLAFADAGQTALLVANLGRWHLTHITL